MRTTVPKDVDEYLAGVPEPARTTLSKVRAAIKAVVPKETTEGISYRIPMYKYKGVLMGFAAFKEHCSLFVTGSPVTKKFAGELKGYPTSKGTIRFPLNKPLPPALVKKIARERVAENEARKRG